MSPLKTLFDYSFLSIFLSPLQFHFMVINIVAY